MRLSEDLTKRAVVYQTSAESLLETLDEEPRSFYVGFDPTADSLHIGHLMQLITARRLQDAGHRPVLVAGGGTGMIGDPSGRSEERNLLSADQLDHNVAALTLQLEHFVDFGGDQSNRATVVDNRAWLSQLTMIDFLRDVGKHFNINHMLQKDSVRNRLGEEHGFSFTEFSYMLLQAFDFYHLYRSEHQVTLQLGGSDQWGNITAGIDFVRRMAGATVYGMTTSLVTKADGKKFGKSEGGAVWLDPKKTTPFALYQFFLRTDDVMVVPYLKYFTFLALDEIASFDERLAGAHGRLAYEVTSTVHSVADAYKAKRASELMYSDTFAAEDLETIRLAFSEAPQVVISRTELDGGFSAVDLLALTPLVKSKGEARRVVTQGGLYINGARCTVDDDLHVADLLHDAVLVLRKGKRDYCLLEAR